MFSKYHNRDSLSVLPKKLYDSLYVNTHYINKRNLVSENCYTTDGLPYYIIPLLSKEKINSVDLVYSEIPITILKAKIGKLFGGTFIENFLRSRKQNEFIKKWFLKVSSDPDDYLKMP